MSEENPGNLSPEKLAEIRSITANIAQYVREALATGTSLEFLRTALPNMGFSKEMVETMIEQQRDRLRREASVDRDFEAANMLARLELLYNLAMRKNDIKTALEVIRERARFTGAATFVKYSTGEPSRGRPSEFEKALDEIGGMERERFRQEILAQAKKMCEKDAGEKGRLEKPEFPIIQD